MICNDCRAGNHNHGTFGDCIVHAGGEQCACKPKAGVFLVKDDEDMSIDDASVRYTSEDEPSRDPRLDDPNLHRYTCEGCGGSFLSVDTQEALEAEALREQGSYCEGPMMRVCDECYQQAMNRAREMGLVQ